MSDHINKSHNKSKETLVQTCKEIELRYDISFIEIGTDEDHVHFLIQSIPTVNVSRIVRVVKSLTAREIFSNHKEVIKQLWGGKFWTSGYYANTVGHYGNGKVRSMNN